MSEEVAYIFINVCRKTREVPALKEAIKTGAITVSKVKKITSVLTSQNQDYWLGMAKTSSKRILEKNVASCAPAAAVKEQLTYVNPKFEIGEKVKIVRFDEVPNVAVQGLEVPCEKSRVQLQVGVSETLMLKLRRAQDLLSQKRQTAVGLEETLSAAIDLYVAKNDPLEKAKRQVIKGKLADLEAKSVAKSGTKPGSTKNPQVPGLVRKPIPSGTRHKLWLKYKGQCAHVDQSNQRCQARRFLHVHHEKPVAWGGANDLANLVLSKCIDNKAPN